MLQTIHLIRHGMGYHNEVTEHEDYQKEAFFDSRLNERGWAQAHALNAHIKLQNLQVDLIVVSPLTRCLETAAGVFGQNVMPEGKRSTPIMVAQDCEEGQKVPHATISQHSAPPVVAVEMCRETLGVRHFLFWRRHAQHRADDRSCV